MMNRPHGGVQGGCGGGHSRTGDGPGCVRDRPPQVGTLRAVTSPAARRARMAVELRDAHPLAQQDDSVQRQEEQSPGSRPIHVPRPHGC